MTHSKLTLQITENLINYYAKVSLDNNPIHLNKQAALAQGLPNKVAHGMLSTALAAKLITPYLQKGYFINSFETKILQPVFVNDTIEVTIQTIKNSQTTYSFRLTGLNSSNEKILSSKIKLKPL